MATLLNIYNTYIVNVLDIFILTIIFYRIILVIKGTRAIQIVVGILFILVLTIVARNILHLKALSWLLENFWFAAVIILAVVFQIEIRNVLAQTGGQIWGAKAKIKDSYVTGIIEAVEDLSTSLTGGLIAIENEIGLKNFTEAGILLNANISKELLLSIFKNKSAPLHDGAVIIFNGKIVAAGCLLPLSHNTNVKIFGTRHRAALGLSEVTDAITIIVSEETGQISVAYKGKLNGNISPAKLREIINTNGEVLKSI
ncbi:MAG: diadenylate cyclase CdaA [Endomicrobium sp.]|jgi:diadenylate cyclase|nr:diadenylate cyclase CdaA [Endomicrobium sp.]